MDGRNILWLMTDEQRKDSLGLYGSSWAQTPNLDRLAAGGAVCENALTGSPVCIPARTSILTGRYPHSTGVWHNIHEKFDYRPLTDILHAAGYQTATFGKQHHALSDRCFEHVEGFGVKHQATHFFHYFEPYDGADYDMVRFPGVFPWVLAGRYPEGEETKVEYQITDRAIEWLDERDAERPFLLRCSFPGPHTPVTPPVPYDTAIDPADIDLPPQVERRLDGLPQWLEREWALTNSADLLTGGQTTLMRQHYYGLVSFLDAQFGRLLDALDERGLLEDTVIGFVSDHGTLLGDYGFVQKGTFYEPDAGVPMFFAGPGVKPGTRITTPVSSVSFLSTLIELAGLEVPAYDGPVSDAPLEASPQSSDARTEEPSLAHALSTGSEPEPHPILSEITLWNAGERAGKQFGPYRGYRHGLPRALVRDGDLKYACALTPEPSEPLLTDLADDPHEVENRAGDEGYRGERERLSTWVADRLRARLPRDYNEQAG
jgi:arylsulfatase A-like enzyme